MKSTLLSHLPASWRRWWQAGLSLIVALLVFSLILLNRSPNLLRPVSISLRTGFALTMLLSMLLLYFSFRIPGWAGRLTALTLTMALFAFPLAGLWASGRTQTTVLSGILPLYDAHSYYTDALRLMAGRDFSDFAARRPLFSGLLSVFLTLTGGNLMASMAIFTAITGLACYLATREIQRTHGTGPAILVLAILFLYYRSHSGSLMSENLGLPLGVLGLALLWHGAADRRAWLVLAGLFTTTLALNARAGAFFELPFLLLWASWLFRGGRERISWKFLLVGGAAIAAGFAVNLVMVRLLASPSGVPFANFSYTLYGVAAGGYHWHYVFDSHPELLALEEPEQSRRVYELAFELIRSNPRLLLQGMLHGWQALFSDSWYSLYSFVEGDNRLVGLAARWGLYVLCILGIYKWLRERSDPFNNLIMAAAAGIFISVPFVPPTDAYWMRPYAASIPFFGLLPAWGAVFLLQRLKTGRASHPMDRTANPVSWSAWGAGLLILVLCAGPVLVKHTGSPPPISAAACETGLEPAFVRFEPGTSINIHRQKELFLDWMPDFHVSLFRLNAHDLADVYLAEWLESINPPFSMFGTLDYRSDRNILVIIDTDLLPAAGSMMELCGHWEQDPKLADYNIFHADQASVR